MRCTDLQGFGPVGTNGPPTPPDVEKAIDALLEAERTLAQAEEKAGPYYAGYRLLSTEMDAQAKARDHLESTIRQHIAQLTAELEAARRDAARYEWLRNTDDISPLFVELPDDSGFRFIRGDELDAAIDAATGQTVALVPVPVKEGA